MTLVIHTGNLTRLYALAARGQGDPDLLDVTRTTANREHRAGLPSPGAPFAPSWSILNPALAARKAGALELHWPVYVEAYRAEMRASYRANRAAWDAFLARDRATIVCMCPRREPGAGQHHTCHRAILASILVKCGAVDCGEVGGSHEVDPHRQHRIPDMSRMVAFSGTRPPKPGTRGPQHREYELLAYRAEEVVSKLPADAVVVHGGAAGIDKVIDDVASVRGLTRWVVRPWWDAWGNVAPKVRNVYVAAAPKVWAFPSSYGTGTQHACGIAREAGCELTIVPP